MATGAIRVPYRRDTCVCGCGRQPREGSLFAWGHKNGASDAAFDLAWKELHENSPVCQCGCGTNVRPAFSAKDKWISCGMPAQYNRFADGHKKCTTDQTLQLTTLERQAILGTLLGDTSIGYPHKNSRNPRLSSTHSDKQFSWAEHKANFLHRLKATTRIAVNDGHGDMSVRTVTACNPCLAPILDLVHWGGRKRVSREWLEGIGDIGLAWWICDDGSGSQKSLVLNTQAFSTKECLIITGWFCDTLGRATVCGIEGRHTIHISSWAQVEVGERVGRYVPNFMRYKLAACDPNRPRKRRRCV